ncbi:MAG: FAD-binding oxidoreductase [Actinomycetota bacterium]|nr:FAD-binding oxidoreductase [Rubrobacteraceae bacterium]MDQ3498045.1 FAD-binding oxidoreductase [Actinomycetota bacterium]
MVDRQDALGLPLTKPLDEADIQGFAAALRGDLIRPEDDRYGAARAVFNAMVDRRPALIVRCASVADVMRGVEFARSHDLPLSIHGGGHSVAGKAVCDGGLMLDLSSMKGIRVDPVRRTAEAQGGLTLGEFDHETQAFGLATTLGVVSVTGIAGLTLGGGLGWLNGLHGLACDNLISAEVVTADGRLLRATEEENEDLFWGIRGGGGNFGVVTSFGYRLHPVSTVLAGGLSYPLAKAHEVLRFYHEFASGCPDELSTTASLGVTPDGVIGVSVCYCGPLEEGERVLRPLREFGSPLADNIEPMAYTTLQNSPDAGFPPGRRHYWKSSYLKELGEEAIEIMAEYVSEMPSPATGVGLQQMHGVASRVDPTATAFPHRDEHYDFLILSQWADPAESERNVEWTRSLFEAMEPFFGEGVYVNNLGDEGEDRVRAAYGANYERLLDLKGKYDPTNLFRLNQNIPPPTEAASSPVS